MGKSPGKWIKSLLLGKKSSKSNLSNGKGKLYATKKEERLISSKLTESGLSVEPQSISAPIPATVTRNGVNIEREISANLPNDGVNVTSIEHDGDHNASSVLSQEDPESLKLEQAATMAQAAFRGFLARRAFRTLKGIIRLQAMIRGHLVRRQAVATLYSAWGIIKFQALVRGQKVRRTDIAIEVQKLHPKLDQVANSSSELSASLGVKNFSNNAFVRKLLDSSPTVLPLRLQYGSGEPNSALEWLERWMKSCFWELPSEPIKKVSSKSRVKNERNQNEQGKTKRTIRKLANGKVENGSSRASSGSEYAKPKRNPRKVPANPADQVQDQSQNGFEKKVKRNINKIPDSSKEVTDGAEVKNETPNQTVKNSTASAAVDVSEEDSAEKSSVLTLALAEPSNLEAEPNLKTTENNGNDRVEELNAFTTVLTLSTVNNGNFENTLGTEELSPKDGVISSESLNTNLRRDSISGKINNPENVLPSMPKVPSYMAPTQSAKAKLRGQDSPRLFRDVVEKNGIIRRHSLPSSANSNLSSLSPRAHKLVQSAGKGALREKSLSSSRDASDKAMKAEWRR